MEKLLKDAKDFKIIPENFKNSGEITIEKIEDDKIECCLVFPKDCDYSDYVPDKNVEVFGANNSGLVYFETKIISRDNQKLILKSTQEYSLIQRREYSRVQLKNGGITIKDMPDDIQIKVIDISAGGIKLETDTELKEGQYYDIEIKLSGNMKIECALQPIRTEKNNNGNYIVSGKFTNLENIDRIVLVQYVFKMKMENNTGIASDE